MENKFNANVINFVKDHQALFNQIVDTIVTNAKSSKDDILMRESYILEKDVVVKTSYNGETGIRCYVVSDGFLTEDKKSAEFNDFLFAVVYVMQAYYL